MNAEIFRECYGRLPEASLLLSAEGLILEWNAAARALVGGATGADLCGVMLADLVQDPPEKVARLLELFCRSLELYPDSLVFRSELPDGIPCRIEGSLLDPAPGQRRLLVRLFSRDETTSRFRFLNEKIDALNRETAQRKGDAVIITDPNARVTLLNRVAETLTGWTQEEAAGRPLDEIFVVSRDETNGITGNRAIGELRAGSVVGMANHTRLTCRDGRRIPIDDTAEFLRDAEGNLTGSVLVFRDLTQRKDAGTEIQESPGSYRELLDYSRAVMNNMAEGLYTVDTQGMVTFVNSAAEKMLGWTSVELMGKRMHDIVHYKHPDGSPFPVTDCPGVQVLRSGVGLREHEDVFIRKGERFFPVVFSASPLVTGGRTVGIVVSFRDDTERRRAEIQRRAAEDELRRANADLNLFAFAASHDLQEPLRMITSYSQLLVRSFQGQAGDEVAAWLDIITDGTARMRDLLSDLLAYSQVSDDERRPVESVDLNRIVEKVRENCRTAIEESHASVTCDPLPIVSGHESHYLPLLQNLVSNAIKYRGDDVPRIHISAEPRDGWWRIAVSDHGIGIAPEYHEKIFGVFKRLHGRMIPGTGIGLAICQRVVEKYGGRIWVESAANQGATFYFTLPRASDAPDFPH